MHWTRDCASVSIGHHWPAPVMRDVRLKTMYLLRRDDIWDPDFDNLGEIAAFLDGKLRQLCDSSVSAEDADAFGYFDQIEHFLGFGLTAFQTYMTDTASCAGK